MLFVHPQQDCVAVHHHSVVAEVEVIPLSDDEMLRSTTPKKRKQTVFNDDDDEEEEDDGCDDYVDRFRCHSCQFTIDTLSNLREHLRLTHCVDRMLYECILCPRHYASKFSLQRHYRKAHDKPSKR